MDDTEDDARYPPNRYGVNQGYGSSHVQKLPVRNSSSYPQPVGNQYIDDDDEDEDEEEELDDGEEEEEEEGDDDDNNVDNDIQRIPKDEEDVDNDDDNDEDDDDDDNDSDDGDDDDDKKIDYSRRSEGDDDSQRHQKKRKLKSLLSSYEFAPRVPITSAATTSAPKKPSFGRRHSLSDWTEHETFVLLDAWGERFLQHGRKSLRSEEWQEVSEKVSQESKIERKDTQCRNRLDTLKKKYKKEKTKLSEIGGTTSKWVYFKKMDMLMSSSSQQTGLSCGVDSGEFVFMNPKVYLNRANGLDEMRDSPGNSESVEGEEDDSDGLPLKRTKSGGGGVKLLADSIQKFSEIYEKIENSKRQQMVQLEKMRMDFHRDLETQKRQILERMRVEIAKIRQGDDEENDVSAENGSG